MLLPEHPSNRLRRRLRRRRTSSHNEEEFHAILAEEELRDAAVLVYANKQDLPGALSEAEVSEGLDLHNIKTRPWAIFKTSAITGDGLWDGMNWLSSTLQQQK